MMLLRPPLQSSRVDQHAQNFGQARLLVVEADQPGKAFLRLEIGIGDAAFEQFVE